MIIHNAASLADVQLAGALAGMVFGMALLWRWADPWR
jgi:hypothetical protein